MNSPLLCLLVNNNHWHKSISAYSRRVTGDHSTGKVIFEKKEEKKNIIKEEEEKRNQISL